MSFGALDATGIAAFLAMLLVPLSRHNTASARTWYDKHRTKYDMWWAPGVVFFPIFWALMYAILTVTIYYFIFVVATAGTWQFIVGFSMFMLHILCLKIWEVAFWEAESPGGAALVFLGIYGSGAVFLAAVGTIQTGLYLVPTLLFSAYLLVLLFPLAINLAVAFPRGMRCRWYRSSHRKYYDSTADPLTNGK